MSREFYKDTQNFFTDGKQKQPRGTIVLSLHNIEDLQPHEEPTRKAANAKLYKLRSGANNYAADAIGTLVENTADPRLQRHAKYLGRLYDRESFGVYSMETLEALAANLGTEEPKPLVVPYINLGEIPKRLQQNPNIEKWGTPTPVVEKLKNKIEFHKLITEAAIPGFEVPKYEIAELSDKEAYMKSSLGVLGYAQDLYEEHGMTNEYPLGLVMRLEDADGGRGLYMVREEEDGRISVKNADASKKVMIDKGDSAWEKAIKASQKLLTEDVDPKESPSVVISRFIDVADSPGLSMIFFDGSTHSLGLNGQLQKEGSLACIGTSTYEPKDPYLQHAKKDIEEQGGEMFAEFMRKVAGDFRGIANVDFMIPGELERKLRALRGKEATLYLAECNARWTNYTDAIMAGIGATGKEPTVSNMRTIISEGLYTEDKVDLRGASPEKVRRVLEANDSRDKDARVIVRMPVSPMGVILLGNKDKGEAELQKAISEVKRERRRLLKPTRREVFNNQNKTS